ncbi:hypothetical protein GmHk_10G030512 [Glycine max]|nr:hypothetical protein GmHk_10G030512 [Glycine max]
MCRRRKINIKMKSTVVSVPSLKQNKNVAVAVQTATLSVRPDRLSPGAAFPRPPVQPPLRKPIAAPEPWRAVPPRIRIRTVAPVQASSRADDSAPFEMSVENALKLLGVSEGASFDDILRAKNAIVANCNDDQDAIAQVEAAYDMLLMQSLTQRRAGKVVNSSVRYADVKRYAGADVPGLLLAGSFGASLYFMTKKNVKLGKATVITIGGLVAGAVVGSAVENWLQVDIVPFLGIHSPAAVVSEIIIISQFLVSLYLR